MSDLMVVKTSTIDLFEMWKAIWLYKYRIIIFTIIAAVISVIYALSLPNIYKAEALLSHSKENDASGLAKMAGQLGGLASIAGINLGGDSNEAFINIERLKSRTFLFEFINKYQLKVPLIAASGWDKSSNKLIIDFSKYDEKSEKWTRVVEEGVNNIPSDYEAYQALIDRLSIEQNKTNGLISLSIEFYDPNIAQKWVSLLVDELNQKMRKLEIREKQKSIDFINIQLDKTSVTEMKNVFYQIIEEQTKSMLLAEVQEDFVFKVIDQAIVPEKKSSPKRAIICIMGSMLGFMFSILFALLVFYLKKYKQGLKG